VLKDLADITAAFTQRAAEHRINPSLDRVRQVLDALGDPQGMFPAIVVAGTNGKSSTTRMIDAIARTHGIRSGAYTSPHLISITERILIDGKPIADERFVEALNEIYPIILMMEERIGEKLTGFELMTVLALSEFAATPMHMAALEIGIGGTWDAVNVVDAAVTAITTIDFDHQNWLGNTIESIAGNKAGVIKPGAITVVQKQLPEALEVIELTAAQMQATMLLEGRDFSVTTTTAVGGQLITIQTPREQYQDLFLGVHGAHQAVNAATALVAVENLLGDDDPLNPAAIGYALENFKMPGRLEVLRRSPTVVIDIAHNPAGAEVLAIGLGAAMNFSNLTCVVGVLDDKDAVGIISALAPLVDNWIVTTAPSERAIAATDLAVDVVATVGAQRVVVESDIAAAFELALKMADEAGAGSGVLITGSATVAGAARAKFGKANE
jgi:dihydrofolate synthase/folylpolyglutamate synthase